MKITTINFQGNQFSLSGLCPHCRHDSVFTIVVAGIAAPTLFQFQGNSYQRIAAAMQCQGCLEFILGVALKAVGHSELKLYAHYPLAHPNDSVPDEIPSDIRKDFAEAIRCRWVDAFNATVEMCRRVVEASSNEQGAPDGRLIDKIDWLAAQQKITAPLKAMAHQIRLGGNHGAHPPDGSEPDPLVIDAKYADAVMEFTEEYLQHVYVMPAKLKKFQNQQP